MGITGAAMGGWLEGCRVCDWRTVTRGVGGIRRGCEGVGRWSIVNGWMVGGGWLDGRERVGGWTMGEGIGEMRDGGERVGR